MAGFNIYNLTLTTKLRYVAGLENTLHIAEIEEEAGSGSQEVLLAKGHVASGQIATFN